jgi:hypothetical protein
MRSSFQRGNSWPILLGCVALGALFVWLTGLQMPRLIASHFALGGIADGFMLRDRYLRFFLCITIILPIVVALPVTVALRNPNAAINLPNRDYWLAPERRAETFAFVRSQMVRFGVALLIFLCYIHWLVVLANRHAPPVLHNSSFVAAIVVLVVFMTIWTIIYIRRFRKNGIKREQP